MNPKPHEVGPKLTRLPKRKLRMTFILGMMCKDGFVMSSDSLEGDGYNKSNVKKLHMFNEAHGQWGVAWGCAGDSPVIKRFDDRLLELLEHENAKYDRHRLEELIESLVKKMHEDYPSERLALVVSICGTNPTHTKEMRLYSVKETSHCLSVEERFACAGMDTSLARFLLDSIVQDGLALLEGAQLAIFVTSVMKEKADGVGGLTQVSVYDKKDGEWFQWKAENIAKLEKMQYCLADVEKAIRQYCWSKTPHAYGEACLNWTPTGAICIHCGATEEYEEKPQLG